MNLVSSKLMKSTRPIVNRSLQTLNAYSCQLYIDSFRINYRGFVYFLWLSNTTQIQSLRYQSLGKTIQVKQTLTISVRISSKNGKEQILNTSLKLMADTGQELDQFELQINSLTPQFKEMEVPMDRGLCTIRVRRRQMNIGEQDQINYRALYRSRNMRVEQKQNMAVGEYDSLQQELNRIKKQLQDQVYLNNKLKNDRDVLLATKQELQLQIQTLLVQITKQISVLRMTIRQHCYEEEIEDIVKTFNSETDHSKKQKNKLQQDQRPLQEKIKRLQHQQIQRDQHIGHLQKQKTQIFQSLRKCEQKNTQLGKNIDMMNRDKDGLGQQINSFKIHIDQLKNEISQYTQHINNQNLQISRLNQKISEIEFDVKNKDVHILNLQENINIGKDKEQSNSKQIERLNRIIEILEGENKHYVEQLEIMKGKFEEYEYEMQFNENVMGQLKKQQTQKQQELYMQIQNLQKIYAKKMEDLMANFQNEKQGIENSSQLVQKQKEDLESKIKQLSNIAQQSHVKVSQLSNEINNLQNEVKNHKSNVQAKDQLIDALQRQNQKLKQQLQNNKNSIKIKSQKSLSHKQLPASSNPAQFDNLKARLLQLQEKNLKMQSELSNAKTALDAKQKQIANFKMETAKYEEQMKKYQNNGDINKSLDSGSKDRLQDKSLGERQINGLIGEKEAQIDELRKKIQQLQHLYQLLQLRLDKILQKYPQIDIAKIEQEAQLEWCESEKQQEKVINANGGMPSPKMQTRHNHSISEEIQQGQFDRLRLDKNLNINVRSLTNINDGYSKGVSKRQSSKRPSISKMDAPNQLNLKKQITNSSFKDERSQKSGTSYVKVSHSKRIKQLEDVIRDFQNKQREYLLQMQGYQKDLNFLRVDNSKQAKVITPKFGSSFQVQKVSTESQVYLEDDRLKNMMQQSQMREIQYQKKNLKIGDLQQQVKQVNQQKMEALKQSVILQSKLQQFQRIVDQHSKKFDILTDNIKQLQKQLAQAEQKLRKQREAAQQARLSVKQINLHLDNAQSQLKKLRHQNQILQQKVQKMSGSQLLIRELSKQIEDMGKKSLQMTRMINHMKLQKDSVDQELRMFKKRQNDQLRISAQWQEKAASLQRHIEELKRKQTKLRRQIQQGQEQVRRSKTHQKKLQEQLQILGAAQAGWQVERRKHLDQISTLQDQLSRKDYDLNKLNKQIQKWRMRADERDDMRLGKKSQLKQQIQRLQNQLIRREKKIFQQTEENKLLRGRLEILQRENKRIIQQKNQSYGQKLKYYVDEMSSIKKLLQQYQNQNSRLKIQNNQLYEQSQMIKINYDKLQARYNQNIQREEDILNDLQSYVSEVNMLKQRLAHAGEEIGRLESGFANLRKQADQDKLQVRKITQKLDASQRNLERALTQIRQYKIKQSQYETNFQINGKIGQRYRILERRKAQLDQELKKIKLDYQNVVNTYVYKRQDLQKAINDARNQQKRLRQEEIQRMGEQYNKTLISKTQRLEQEILDLYNQNSRIRAQLQVFLQQNGRQKGRITELQITCQRINALQAENQLNKNSLQELKQQLKRKNERANKLEVAIEGLQSQNNLKERQLNGIRNRIKQLEKHIEKLNEQLKARRNAEKQLQDALIRATDKKQKQKTTDDSTYRQRETQIIQQYESKISSYESQLQKAKQRENKAIQQNASKMKKLQQKLDEMEEALRQKQKAIEGHYEGELRQMQASLVRLSQELEEKLIRIDQLNEAIILLEGQNKQLIKQMDQIRYQHQEQKHIFEIELNKLKLKMKDSQATYANSLKLLEEELMRATQSKANNISGSRLKTNQAEQRISKRYEQKLKNKDKKIQQLKENIYTLQETLLKLKKKETIFEANLAQIQKLKLIISQLQKEKKRVDFEWGEELNKNTQLIRQLRKQILRLKEEEEKARLTAQQKILQYESIACQMKTIKQLYHELQKELQRRKNNLSMQIQEESSLQHQVRIQQSKIIELQERILQGIKTIKELQLDIKRRNTEIKKYIQTIEQMRQAQEHYKIQIGKLTTEIVTLKKSINQYSTSCDSAKNQLKQSKAEVIRLRKGNQDLKALCSSKEEMSVELKRINQQLMIRYREYQEAARRYSMLNQRSREEIGCGIEEIIQKYSILAEEKDVQANQLVQQIQELKFLNERKFMDYDQMKKMNFQLQLKVEESEGLNDQLETLRKICDKLQQQKKNSVFRQEVLRMQIQNLGVTGSPELRSRIQGILAAPIVPSYTNFSFY